MAQPNTNKSQPNSDEMVFKAVDQIAKEASPEIQNGMKALVDKIFNKGMLPKDALGLKDEMLEGLYGQSYHLFNNGRYDDALTILRLLVLLNSLEPKYSMGVAAALHMKKDYEAAGQMYGVVGLLDLENPMPYYHASDCYIKLNNIPLALESLKIAAERCEDQEQYRLIKDRCLMTIKSLESGAAAPSAEPPKAEKPKGETKQ